tara:strand:+ start:2016 stop:2147 length:132 start_codon:yes stop_codon:yes gene_type:complete
MILTPNVENPLDDLQCEDYYIEPPWDDIADDPVPVIFEEDKDS